MIEHLSDGAGGGGSDDSTKQLDQQALRSGGGKEAAIGHGYHTLDSYWWRVQR